MNQLKRRRITGTCDKKTIKKKNDDYPIKYWTIKK